MAETAQAAQAPPRDGGKKQRQLKNYLINRHLQLRFTLIIVAISAILTGSLGWVIMYKQREASRLVQVRAMDPTDELAQQLVGQFARGDQVIMAVLIGFGLLLCLILSAYSIVLTH